MTSKNMEIVPINQEFGYVWTALHQASAQMNVRSMAALLREGNHEVNQRTPRSRMTALGIALKNEFACDQPAKRKIVKLLRKHGATE